MTISSPWPMAARTIRSSGVRSGSMPSSMASPHKRCWAATGRGVLAGGLAWLSALESADQQPARDLLLQGYRDGDDRRDHDHDQHRHIAPFRATGAVLGRDQDRHGLRLGVREEERQQILVPGEDEDEEEGRDEAGADERQGDHEEDAEFR